MDVKICKDYGWFYYIGENIDSLLDYKCGKWMYFFNNADFVAEVCEKAVRSGVVVEAKHMDHHEGVACFYLNIDDYEAHRRVIEFFIENKLIRTTKTGKYYNITFKRDNQTLRGMYNSSNNFSSELKLDKFIDLKSGQWVLNEKDLYGLLPLEVKLLSRTQNCALNKTIYGTDTLHKYISLAFPNTAPIMTSPDNYEVGFWQENNIPNGVFRKKLYIVTFNAVFYLKAGETPHGQMISQISGILAVYLAMRYTEIKTEELLW